MIKDHKEYITKAKQKELIAELEQLKTVERKKIAEKLEYARGLGDLSENAEYHDAREAQSELEGKIENIENILNTAEIITNTKSDTVIMGSKVTLRKPGLLTSGEIEQVRLVGPNTPATKRGRSAVATSSAASRATLAPSRLSS